MRIRELRLQKNITQNELAVLVKSNQSSIGKYERGELEPNLELLNKFADIFEVSIDYLVGREDDFGIIKTAPALPDEQAELLSLFNKLGPYQQEYIKGQIVALLQTDSIKK